MADAPSSKRETPSVDSVVRLSQVVAMLVAAGWGLYLYVSFQRTANQQILDQQALANEQAKLQIRTSEAQRELRDLELKNQVALQELSKSQGELALRQSQFALDQDKASADLTRAELQNRVALQTLQTALEETRLEREHLDLDAAKDRGFACGTTAELLPSEGELRNVNYAFTCEVMTRSSVHATGIVIDYFIGHLDSEKLDSERFALLAAPPGRWANTRPVSSALRWTRVGSWGGLSSDTPRACEALLRGVAADVDFVRSAPGTGEWKEKEKFSFTSDVVVKASPDDYFGIAFSLITNKSCNLYDDPYNFTTYYITKSLRSVEKPTLAANMVE